MGKRNINKTNNNNKNNNKNNNNISDRVTAPRKVEATGALLDFEAQLSLETLLLA